jgi:hypothetical protein
MARYLADPCPQPSLSSGACQTMITKSAQHVWASHPRLGGRVEDHSDASDIGTIAHDLLLGGEGRICVIEPADYRSKPTKDNPDGAIPVGWTNGAIRAARDEARANGLTPILAGAMAGARTMAKVARDFIDHSEVAGVFDAGEGEVSMLYERDGVWFRARTDWMNHERKIKLHYKTTTATANPESFSRLAVGAGYDVSLAFYRMVFEGLTQQKDWQHVILAQEQSAPYACSLLSLDPAAWAIAVDKVNRAVRAWSYCVTEGQWPAFSGRIHYVTPTPWALAEAEAMQQEN